MTEDEFRFYAIAANTLLGYNTTDVPNAYKLKSELIPSLNYAMSRVIGGAIDT
jgi:hypothetical protein